MIPLSQGMSVLQCVKLQSGLAQVGSYRCRLPFQPGGNPAAGPIPGKRLYRSAVGLLAVDSAVLAAELPVPSQHPGAPAMQQARRFKVGISCHLITPFDD
jgi:hypothetical protein